MVDQSITTSSGECYWQYFVLERKTSLFRVCLLSSSSPHTISSIYLFIANDNAEAFCTYSTNETEADTLRWTVRDSTTTISCFLHVPAYLPLIYSSISHSSTHIHTYKHSKTHTYNEYLRVKRRINITKAALINRHGFSWLNTVVHTHHWPRDRRRHHHVISII